MRRFLAAAAFLGLVLALGAGGTRADDKKKAKKNDGVVENWDKPKEFAAGKVNAYWLWYEKDAWHLRTTGGGKGAHRFHGLIEVTGGKLVGLKGGAGEFGGKNVDRFVFNKALTAIEFDFKTDEGVDGLNFAVDRTATELKFKLALDGSDAPKHIRIGLNGDHPADGIFTVPARPTNKEVTAAPKKKN